MKFTSDIDIDFANRDDALRLLKHVPASMVRDGELAKHASGVYFTSIPVDSVTGAASIEYHEAEARGYLKLDFLNVSIYQQVRDEEHLVELMTREPIWDRLNDRQFVEQLMHIGSHYDSLRRFPEPVDSIPRLAMFLAVIRPAKRHLIGLPWREVAKTIWDKPADDNYYFKKSHAIAYSTLVVVHMNLLCDAESVDSANQSD